MAERQLHILAGQSNAVGVGSYATLTDLTYETPAHGFQWKHLPGINTAGGWSAIDLDDGDQFSIEAPIAQILGAAGGNPLILRCAQSGTDLAVAWRPHVAGTLWATLCEAVWAAYDDARRTTFSSDTIRIASLSWLQFETDTSDPDDAAAYGDNLARLIDYARSEFGVIPFFTQVPHDDFTGQGPSDAEDIAAVKAGILATVEAYDRAYAVDTNQPDISLSDGSHYTADSRMRLGEDWAAAMLSDGLATTPLTAQARVWTVEASAQTFADTAQTDYGDRDEDPAEGGFGIRLGAGCRDPWPTTERDALEKHPVRAEWAVLIDGVIDADEGYDVDTDRRPIDLRFWRHE